jgi:hypothetical protein
MGSSRHLHDTRAGAAPARVSDCPQTAPKPDLSIAADADEDHGLGAGGHSETHRKHHHPPTPAETGGPLAKYETGLAAGQYRPDPRQRLTIQMLQVGLGATAGPGLRGVAWGKRCV